MAAEVPSINIALSSSTFPPPLLLLLLHRATPILQPARYCPETGKILSKEWSRKGPRDLLISMSVCVYILHTRTSSRFSRYFKVTEKSSEEWICQGSDCCSLNTTCSLHTTRPFFSFSTVHKYFELCNVYEYCELCISIVNRESPPRAAYTHYFVLSCYVTLFPHLAKDKERLKRY